ncbi:myristylprotein / IMV protein [Squirrelpox virus]|uniref:Myristylprotein / IMV protein n=1 Tax=Squirrelpox virus TaxID=240426 RepID=U3UBH7_9POXV|nr:myristylprotein / IMV protein [Squirrelpox virus]CCD83236.1 myristylprotein / IMV protein [Squirrelpox virus]
MGGSLALPTRAAPPRVETPEMKIKVRDVLGLLPTRGVNALTHVGREDAALHDFVQRYLPEFDVYPTGPGLAGLVRKGYAGEASHCCRSFERTHYWEDDAGRRFPDYAEGRALRTCEPEMHARGDCDVDLFEWCRGPDADAALCRHWIGASAYRGDLDASTAQGGSTAMALFGRFVAECSQDALRPMCAEWLHALRMGSRPDFDLIVDDVLESQSPEFKAKYMRCSYPSGHVLDEALRDAEPRECWDPNCATANVVYMLTRNYRNLGLCKIMRCNVSIDHLDADAHSRLRLGCGGRAGGAKGVLAAGPVNRLKVVETNIRRSFDTRFGLAIVLSILIIYLLIVAF